MILTNQNTIFSSKLSALVCLVAIVVGFGLSGCGGAEEAEPTEDTRPVVVATTTMLEDLTRTLAADHVQVVGLMKPGQDPHVYEVLPRDAQSIAAADLVIANGLNLEATLHNVIENNTQGKVVYAAEQAAITPLGSEDYAGAPDPHCWMDVDLYRSYTTAVRDALMEVDPANADAYKANAASYLQELTELHAWALERFAEVPEAQRVIVTSHDAFNYFGEAYGIEVHGVIGISTEQAPRPQDIAALEELVRDRNVKALFIESSVVPTLNAMVEKVAEQTATNVGGTLYSDSLGGPGSGADTYLGMIRHNVNTVVDALK